MKMKTTLETSEEDNDLHFSLLLALAVLCQLQLQTQKLAKKFTSLVSSVKLFTRFECKIVHSFRV